MVAEIASWPPTEILTIRRPRRILIDPGHGGAAFGCRVGHFKEKDFTLAISRRIVQRLRGVGFICLPTRRDDVLMTLDSRRSVCFGIRPDIVISIHADHNNDERVSGMRCYCLPGDDSAGRLGEAILKNDFRDNARVGTYVSRNRTRVAKLAVIKTKPAPHWTARAENVLRMFDGHGPLLIECGFATNGDDQRFMLGKAGQTGIVNAIVTAVIETR